MHRGLVEQGLLGSERGRKLLLPGVCSVLKADRSPGRPEGGGRGGGRESTDNPRCMGVSLHRGLKSHSTCISPLSPLPPLPPPHTHFQRVTRFLPPSAQAGRKWRAWLPANSSPSPPSPARSGRLPCCCVGGASWLRGRTWRTTLKGLVFASGADLY